MRAENTARRMAGMVPENEAGESIWIDVIRKMDEVYADLIQYEAALEQKNAALQESQQFILSVLTSMSDVLIVCDRHGQIQEVNQALVSLTGRTPAALVGSALPELFADAPSREQAARLIDQVQGGGPIQDCELHIAAAGGAMPVALNCTPRFNPLGKLVGLVVAGRPSAWMKSIYWMITWWMCFWMPLHMA